MQPTIIKRTQVQLEERQVTCASGKKSARLLEDQGQVRAIELRCSCGEITVFELEFAANQPNEAPSS